MSPDRWIRSVGRLGGPNFPFQSAGCGIAAASRPPQNGFQRGNETKRTNPLPAPQLNRPIGGGLFRPPPQVLRSPPNTTSHSRQRELSAHLIPDCQRGLIAAPPPPPGGSPGFFFPHFFLPLSPPPKKKKEPSPHLTPPRPGGSSPPPPPPRDEIPLDLFQRLFMAPVPAPTE